MKLSYQISSTDPRSCERELCFLASKFGVQPWVLMCQVSSLAALCYLCEDMLVAAEVCVCVLSVLHGVVSLQGTRAHHSVGNILHLRGHAFHSTLTKL